MALAVAVLFGLSASVGPVEETYWLRAAGALIGLLVVTSFMVAVALSLSARDARDRDLALEPETTQPLQPQTSYQFPTA